MTHRNGRVAGHELKRLEAASVVTSSPTLVIGTDVVEQIVDEITALRAIVEAVRPFVSLLPVEVAESIEGEPIDRIDQDRERLRAALAGVARVVMPDIGHGGHYEHVVTFAESVVAERDRLRAAIGTLRPYRVAIRADDLAIPPDLADAILAAVAAIDPKAGT